MPEECLKYCDIVVRGEGEETLYEIVRGHSLDTIEGISYWRDGKVFNNEKRDLIKKLDDLPFPAHHLFDMKKYKEFPWWGIMGSRGCPFKCIFCYSPQMWGYLRTRSAKNIVDEIEYLHNNFGIRGVSLFDDIINIPQRRALELCDEIIKRDLYEKMEFACQIRADKRFTSMELFWKLKEANFTHVNFGVESGSKRVLKQIRKDLNLKEVRETIKMARKAKIKEIKTDFSWWEIGEKPHGMSLSLGHLLFPVIQMQVSPFAPLSPGRNSTRR